MHNFGAWCGRMVTTRPALAFVHCSRRGIRCTGHRRWPCALAVSAAGWRRRQSRHGRVVERSSVGIAMGDGRPGSMTVAADEFGVRVCSYEDILQIGEDGRRHNLSALVDPLLRREAIERQGQHVLMPLLRNGSSPQPMPEGGSYRCYLWFLESGRNGRKCVLVDVTAGRLRDLLRLDSRNLEKVVLNLLGELPIETI